MVVGYLGGGFEVPGESANQSKSSSSSESESSDVVQCGVVWLLEVMTEVMNISKLKPTRTASADTSS